MVFIYSTVGGLRSADCQVELELCYRLDTNNAPETILIKFSQPLPSPAPAFSTTAWTLSLSNGWCLYAKLFNVSDSYALTFSTSINSGLSWTAGGSVTVPPLSACSSTLSPPIISPLGFSSLGPVVVTLTTTAANAATYYQLTGSGYSPPVLYTGPFILNQPGNTTVLTYSSRAGSLTSIIVVATYIIRYCSNSNITSMGVAPIPSGTWFFFLLHFKYSIQA